MQPQNFYIIFEINFLAILSEATKKTKTGRSSTSKL